MIIILLYRYLRVTQMPRCQDVAIIVAMTTDKPIAFPLEIEKSALREIMLVEIKGVGGGGWGGGVGRTPLLAGY